MLEYEWGNPSAMILSVEEPNGEPDPNRHIFDGHYATAATTTAGATQPSLNETLFLHPNNSTAFSHQNHPFHNPNQAQQPHHAHLHSLYDPRAYSGGVSVSAYSTLSLDPLPGTLGSGGGYFLVPKSEEVSTPVDFSASRIGLNLGGRTYFSSAEDEFVNRLYRRSRTGDPGSMINVPRCQAEACNADLTHAKHYHRRHKVCEFHSKASTVIAAGLTQRFCQQCSRFHLLSEFDNGKRSCRKRLADHNRRRRKSQVQQQQQPNNGGNSSSDNPTTPRSPPDSRSLSFSSSVTMTVSPPRASLDGFGKRPYNPTASASSSSSRTNYFSSN